MSGATPAVPSNAGAGSLTARRLNPRLARLQPYPFERYRAILRGVEPSRAHTAIDLSIGEPRHPTPAIIRDALVANLDGLGQYPPTAGSAALRAGIAQWLMKRFAPVQIDADTDVLPVLGSREALFALAQTVIDPGSDALAGTSGRAMVVTPNPFYQIYEGAALLAGADVHYVRQTPDAAQTCDWQSVPATVWERTQLLFVCSPGNPTGSIMEVDEWKYLFELSDQYGFVIAADECYSELYPRAGPAPVGALQAAALLERDLTRLVAFGSLSKRSNAPGLRSGYVAGDPVIMAGFLRYRTYHGSAMSATIQAASVAAWSDESHVDENRRVYDAKFSDVLARLAPVLAPGLVVTRPAAGFYLWAGLPHGDDVRFGVELLRQYNVRILPGSLLGREVDGHNPGAGRVRLALVAEAAACSEAADRIAQFCREGAGC